MFGWLKKKQQAKAAPQQVRASYDAGKTTTSNSRHWANADGLSADASLSKSGRKTLRDRSRYEFINSPYYRGIIKTFADDCIGTGPRLQLLSADENINNLIEKEFNEWAECSGFAETLRTMKTSKIVDGETIMIVCEDNPKLKSAVKLSIKLVEADRLTSDYDYGNVDKDDKYVDGIKYDKYGNPESYRILKQHPGSNFYTKAPGDADIIDADYIIHWYTASRPGQHRGSPELVASLPLSANIRDYTSAVIKAARTAANISLALKTTGSFEEGTNAGDTFDVFSLEDDMVTVLPDETSIEQIKAEQPTNTYGEFKSEIINEMARPISMPYNVAAGNSSGYNYASGRLDKQQYFRVIRIVQMDMVRVVLNKVFDEFLSRLALVPGFNIPAIVYKRQWFFDGYVHVDPVKEAKAQEIRLANGTTTRAIESGEAGRDWRTIDEQRAIEMQNEIRLGLRPDSAKVEAEKAKEEENKNAKNEN